MKYKIIACDMDETFLNDQSEIPDNNLNIVKILDEEYGIKFVPASGRGHYSLQNEIRWLGYDKKDKEYIIGLNGATITEANSGEILYFKGLDYKIAKELFEFGKNEDICIEIYTSDNLYVYNLSEDEKEYMLKKDIKWIDIVEDSIDFLKNENIAKVLFQKTDMEFLKNLKKNIIEVINHEVSITYSSNRYLEFNSPRVNKGEGIKNLCEILNINKEEVIAIGDNHNDIDMLKVAGLSISVSNAVDEVKEMVDYIGKYNNNDGILEEVFNKFIKDR
ncbi:HAD family hydrolase [Miniphocaeibacter massiliensis]|uniref:HAD family hydrolase n=1 Tax=Miniphocaeibacter massiliensis TaxID=2041841 RepID=UPI000C1BA176|nr:HAD family hydrolase [Miniphocaeibacter massiliensis]